MVFMVLYGIIWYINPKWLSHFIPYLIWWDIIEIFHRRYSGIICTWYMKIMIIQCGIVMKLPTGTSCVTLRRRSTRINDDHKCYYSPGIIDIISPWLIMVFHHLPGEFTQKKSINNWFHSTRMYQVYPPTPADARGSAPGNKTLRLLLYYCSYSR